MEQKFQPIVGLSLYLLRWEEIQIFGYGEKAPLEGMAYGLQKTFEEGVVPFDVEKKVVATL